MKHIVTLFLFVGAFVTPIETKADEPPGWQEYTQGDFYAARNLGQTAHTAEGFAEACRSGLVIGGFLENGQDAVRSLHGAIDDCAKVLSLKPDHYLAKLSLSVAISFEGKRLQSTRYPKQAKALIEQLVQQEAENPIGYGAMGAWNAEISAAGFFARLLLGANRKTAKHYYTRAVQLGMEDFALRLEYIKYLARGNRAERRVAVEQAQILVRTPTTNAFEAMLKDKCNKLLRALKSGKKNTIKKAVIDVSAFKDITDFSAIKAYDLRQITALLHRGPPDSMLSSKGSAQ